MNGSDPSGALWGWILALAAIAAVGIDVGLRTGDPLAAWKASVIAGVTSVLSAGLAQAGLAVVQASAMAAGAGEAVAQWIAYTVGFASGGYGVAEAAQNGMYATAAVAALLLAVGAYGLFSKTHKPPPRPLTEEEREVLRRIIGTDVDWNKVKLDEGFFGESGAHGQVRSDREIDVTSQYSTWSESERLALLTHEGVHIWQRQHGLLDNFRGAWLHIKSFVLQQDPYVVPKDFRGSFWQLNIEQQGAVVGDFVGMTLDANFGISDRQRS